MDVFVVVWTEFCGERQGMGVEGVFATREEAEENVRHAATFDGNSEYEYEIFERVLTQGKKVASDPFAQGLDVVDAVALMKTTKAPDRQLQRKYQGTPHFAALKAAGFELHGRCQVCHSKPQTSKLTFHHVTYKTLFREDVVKDGLFVCPRCHSKLHGKG